MSKRCCIFVVLVPFQPKLGDQVVVILLFVKGGIQTERRNGWKIEIREGYISSVSARFSKFHGIES